MWPLRLVDEDCVKQLAVKTGITPAFARVLWLRGVRDELGVDAWLRPSIDKLHPPAALPDFEPSVGRINQAIRERETILIWGHDDLDGITATVILSRVLTDLQGRVLHYIPTKGREPHGLNPAVALGYRDKGVRLVITVDCGITNHSAVAELSRQGIDVIVTDHHEVLATLPSAVANVDPKRPDSMYPFRGLAGAGVAFKLAMGLVERQLGLSHTEFCSVQTECLALAILGTLADRVPLVGENRTLVAGGHCALESSSAPVIAAVRDYLRGLTGHDTGAIVSELLGLFAAANGNEGVERMLTSTPEQARLWIAELASRSEDWRKEAEQSYARAERNTQVGDGILFVRSTELNPRTLGYCAARLKERYQLPAIVLKPRGDVWVGECRGVDGIDLMDLLKVHADYFIDYGGHRKAAGFTIVEEKVDCFIRSAEQYAHDHFACKIEPENILRADAELPLAEFTTEFASLVPFGEGNRPPLLVAPCERLVAVGSNWVSKSRLDLRFGSRQNPLAVPDEREVSLLYTVDVEGKPVLVAIRPVADKG